MSDDSIMEFVTGEETIAINSDLTMLPEGNHKVDFVVEGQKISSPVVVSRELDNIKYTYELNGRVYHTMITPDGRIFTSAIMSGVMSPSEYQSKGQWRYMGR